MSWLIAPVLSALVIVLSFSGVRASDDDPWSPVKPVEFVIMGQEGSSADKIARKAYSLIAQYRLLSTPVYMTYKSANGGAEALEYLSQAKDADTRLLVTSEAFLTLPLHNKSIDIFKFAAIAELAREPFLICAGDPKVRTFKDLLAVIKAKPQFIVTGAQDPSQASLLTRTLGTANGKEIVYIAMGNEELAANIVSDGFADSSVGPLSEYMALRESMKLTPIAVSAETRMKGYPDIPTFVEAGAPIRSQVTRSVVGGPGMSADARDYYALVFASLYRTNEWRGFLDEIGMASNFVTGQGLRDEWRRRLNETYVMLARALVAKQ